MRSDDLRMRLEALRVGIGKSAVIYPATVLQSIAFGTISLGLVFHLRGARGLQPGFIGLFIAFWNVCYFAACTLLSRSVARLLPRQAILIATVCTSLLTVAIVASPWLSLAFLLVGVLGVVQVMFWPPVMGWLSSGAEGEQLGRTMARFNVAWSFGAVLSPFVGGKLSEIAGSVAMLVGAGLSAVVALIVALGSLLLPRVRADRVTEGLHESAGGVEDRSTPIRFPAWAGVTVAYVLMGVLGTVFPLYATEQLAMSRGMAGLLLLVRAAAAAVVFAVMGHWTFWQFRGAPMIVAQMLLAVAALLLARAHAPLAIAAAFVGIGALAAVAYVESIFHGVAGSVERTRRMALHEGLINFGSLTGSLGGGFLYQKSGMSPVLAVYAAGLVVAAGLQTGLLVSLRRKRAAAALRP